MELRKKIVVLLALLLAAMAMVPLVSADGSSIPEPGKLAELEKIPIPSLQFDYSKTPGVMNGEFLLTNDDRESSVITHQGDGKFSVPSGAVIHHSNDGITRVFDKKGKQIFEVNDKASGIINTPKGPFPASHVFEVPSGAFITDNGKKTFVIYENQVICTVINEDAFTNSDAKGQSLADQVSTSSVVPLTTPFYGWIEYAYDRTTTSLPLTLFDGYWNVPASPVSRSGTGSAAKTIFLFNSIEDYPAYSAIIQPVLEWNNIDTGYYWDIASWAVRGTNSFHSTRITVSTGHTIRGQIQWSSSTQAWYITTYDTTAGSSTSLTTTWMSSPSSTSLEESMALEGKNITSNNDVPGDTLFTNMVYQSSGQTEPIVLKRYISPSAPLTQLNVEILTNPSVVRLDTAN